MYQKIIEEIKQNSEPKFAEWLRPFLSINSDSKEVLLGVRTPILRRLAKKYKDVDLEALKRLLTSNPILRALSIQHQKHLGQQYEVRNNQLDPSY